MQTQLSPSVRETADGRDAEPILRSCVHCGFCTATCPTYQLRGDELDGPRGRIYLIKNLLEGQAPSREAQVHLDRCLTCLNCETTCPSGVQYHHLLDIARNRVERSPRRPAAERVMRWCLRQIVPYPWRLRPMLWLARTLRPVLRPVLPPLLPRPLRQKLPAVRRSRLPARTPDTRTGRVSRRKVIVLDNCAEPMFTPATVAALERILAALDIQILRARGAGCCGAIAAHLAAPGQARQQMRRNIDAWWPLVEAGAEAILIAASGCGATVKDYGWHLRNDPRYVQRAARIASLARDPSEYLSAEEIAPLAAPAPERIVFHPPCTLQHGQRLAGRVESLLKGAGFVLLPVRDSHGCCGSAGTYSILQAGLANPLRQEKLQALEASAPTLIATANVGCQIHLQAGTERPVVHWLELFDPARGEESTSLLADGSSSRQRESGPGS